VGQRLRELDALPHALAVAADAPVHVLAQPESLEHRPGAPPRVGGAEAAEPQHPGHESAAAHRLVQPLEVGAVADVPPRARPGRPPAGRHAAEADRAEALPQDAARQLEQRRLAGAVLPDETGDPGTGAEGDLAHRRHLAVPLADVLELECAADHPIASARRIRFSTSAVSTATSRAIDASATDGA
jgi:hypothetical protein